MQVLAAGGGTAAGDSAGGPSPRLVRAAHEFEGQMMKELLKPMTNADALTGDEEDGNAEIGSGGTLSEFAAESLGQALSQRGGFGIADRIIEQLSRSGSASGNGHPTGKVTRNLHGDTVMRSSE